MAMEQELFRQPIKRKSPRRKLGSVPSILAPQIQRAAPTEVEQVAQQALAGASEFWQERFMAEAEKVTKEAALQRRQPVPRPTVESPRAERFRVLYPIERPTVNEMPASVRVAVDALKKELERQRLEVVLAELRAELKARQNQLDRLLRKMERVRAVAAAMGYDITGTEAETVLRQAERRVYELKDRILTLQQLIEERYRRPEEQPPQVALIVRGITPKTGPTETKE